MKKLLLLLSLILLAIPNIALGAFSVPMMATSTTQGWVAPARVNGVDQTIVSTRFVATSTTATSTFVNLSAVNASFTGNLYLPTTVYTSFTQGSVVFAGASGVLAQDNASFFFDNANNRLGIGTNAPDYKLTVSDSTADGIAGRFSQAGTGSAFGIYSTATGAGTQNIAGYFSGTGATSNYGIFIDAPDAAANQYALYSDATAQSYFAGSVGIGVAIPFRKLHVSLANTEMAHFGSGYGGSVADGTYSGISLGYIETGPAFAKSAIVQAQTGDNSARGTIHILNNNTATAANATLADARLSVTAAGNVGVGTTTPIAKLQVAGNGSYAADSVNNGLTLSNETIPTERIHMGVDSTLGSNGSGFIQAMRSGVSFNVPLLLNPSNGNVGIGTTTPQTKLTISGGSVFISASGSSQDPGDGAGTGLRMGYRLDSSNDFGYINANHTGISNSKNLVLQSAGGSVGIGTTTPVVALTVATDNDDKLHLVGKTSPLKQLRLGYADTGNYGYIQALQSGTAFRDLILNGSGGNVGIGTTTPGAKLHVLGTTQQLRLGYDQNNYAPFTVNSSGTLTIEATNPAGSGTVSIVPDGTLNLGTASTDAINIGRTDANILTTINGLFSVQNFGGTQGIYQNASANVGIGTTTPDNKLTITGNAGVPSDNAGQLRISGSTDSKKRMLFGVNTDEAVMYSYIQSVHTDTAFRDLVLNQGGGNVGIGTSTPQSILDIAAATPTLRISDTTTGISSGGAYGNIDFYSSDTTLQGVVARIRAKGTDGNVGGDADLSFWTYTGGNSLSEKMRILSSGQVGIGTTTPLANLQVTASAANATTSIQFGKPGQNKGTCRTEYDTAGSPVYIYIAAGATSYTFQNGGTAPSGCQN